MRSAKDHFVTNRDERGVTLILAAVCLLMLLCVCALAIDLASLYVSRDEAQRAADAAALAGAKVFVETGCVSSTNCSFYQTQAQQRAIDVGGQNTVGNQNASIQSADVTFTSLNSNNPRITVLVQRSAARSNPVPTFFAKIFGQRSVDVSAAATAEAYDPSGSGPGICTACIKPFVLPNCDPIHTSPSNPACGSTPQGYFVNNGQIDHPDVFPSGVVGMPWQIHSTITPSQFGAVDLGGGQSSFGQNILSCANSPTACGSTLPTLQGKQVGQVNPTLDTLINASRDGLGNGQDTITVNSIGPPFTIQAGSNNPLVQKGMISTGSVINTSSSLATFPVASQADITSGKQTITIQGYLLVFIQDVNHSGTTDYIDAIIMGISGCGTGSPSCAPSTSVVSGGGTTAVPIRLVRNPGS
jgi:putative Flp pilus-assembly TadE/G-like protein